MLEATTMQDIGHGASHDTGAPDMAAIEAIVHARHGDPFGILGPHDTGHGRAIRAFLPDAERVVAVARDGGAVLGPLHRVHAAGFWSGIVGDGAYRLRATYHGGVVTEAADPYAFGPVLGALDLHLLSEGRHLGLGQALGAHPHEMDGVAGTRFAVWAPNAQRVSVIGDFDFWDGRRHPMRRRYEAGVWELFLPGVQPGALYKYEVTGARGGVFQKADPVAWAAEIAPKTASIVVDAQAWQWGDESWMQGRAAAHAIDAPISTYEVHAASWLPAAELGAVGWDGLAERLIPYVAQMGFTHLELLPIMEHPFGGSWGYQPLGQFAPSAPLGPPSAFARFVDRCHRAGVGVILDWVPAHFPTDAHGLATFDGTALYEHEDPRQGFHQDWNTLIYNLGRNEVRGFLIASALHWLEVYHVDALRVDAVASMLYLDYSRQPGEWVPNQLGGRENLESVHFLQELSVAVEQRCPGTMLIAEESTAWPNVTRPAAEGGLGFHYKWNMGWMHDTLHYLAEDPVNRKWHHGQITFGLIYVFTERFVLPLSHDEVVYGKGSLLRKMVGDRWQKFANLRAYYAFMWAYPSKKLLFMGCEIAQDREWNHDAGLDWFLLDDASHRGVQHLVRDLNRTYRAERALHAGDCVPGGFQWAVVDDAERSVYAFLRLDPAGTAPPCLVVSNFTPMPQPGYRIGVPQPGLWREIVNTDADAYGGSGMGNGGSVVADPVPERGQPASLVLTLPPLATVILRADS